MPECNHCDDEFNSEKKLAKHYKKQHEEDLSRIEQKLVEKHSFASDFNLGDYAGAFAIGFIILVAIAAIAWGFLFSGGGDSSSSAQDAKIEPTAVGSVHHHGNMEVVVGPSTVDFSQSKYQLQDRAFHFERGNGETWHAHAQGVSLEYALETLGFKDVTQNSVTFNGQTYAESDGDTVEFIVNNRKVNPREYTLQDGDEIRVLLKEDG